MPLESIQLGPWHGGVRYDIPVEEVGAEELSYMQNTRIGTAGELETRPGSDSYGDAAALASAPTLTLVCEFEADASTTYVVIAAGTALYKYSNGWSAITGATTITAADDNTFEWANANGTLVITNGVDTDAIKWTGSGNASALDDDARFSKGKHIAWFDNRLWIGNVNGATGQLWYSDTADIETWGATSFFNFGGILLGLVPSQNALMVHTSDGIYTLIATGNSSTPYIANKRTSEAGIDGRSCVALPGDSQLMVQAEGVYEWSGGSEIVKISDPLDNAYWPNLNKARLSKAFALRFPRENEVWFALPYGAAQTKMNNFIVWNYRKRRWHGPYNGITRNCAALVANKPHLGGFDGILYDHDTDDESDDGTPITAIGETGAPPPYGPDVHVGWVGVRFFYDANADASVAFLQQGAELEGNSEVVDLGGGAFILDDPTYGKLDNGILLADAVQLSQDKALFGYGPQSSIRLTQNAAGQSFTFRKLVLQYEVLGRTTKPEPVDA